ncbi:hypothetical protein ACFYW8_40625 [Streptomyces sp. NPDC002742]|uniref:hypothetical protein n=1 Tax=Streptomyces sp. NPDC002742 TaxID=3364663 RepID=UPI0036AE3597
MGEQRRRTHRVVGVGQQSRPQRRGEVFPPRAGRRQSRQVRPVFTGADVPGDSALCVPSRCTLTAGQEIFSAWIFGT